MDDRIGELLSERLARHRRESLVQLAFVLVTTPILVAALAFTILLWSQEPRGVPWWLARIPWVVTSANFMVFGFYVSYFLAAPIPGYVLADPRWLRISVLSAIGMFVLSYVPGIYETMGVLFWPPYVLLGVLAIAALGLAYEPKDTYYLGWLGGWMDDPFTCEDDYDRGHLHAGFAVVVPALILGLWADLFSSRGLLRAFDGDDLELAARVLRSLDEHGAGSTEWLLAHGTRRPARVLKALSRLRLILPTPHGLALTSRGGDLLTEALGSARTRTAL